MSRTTFMAAALLCMTARAFCAGATDGIHTNGFRTLELPAFSSATERELPALPAGLHSFYNVPFRTGQPIAVTGIDSARTGDFFPTEVNGIKIGAKARRIHLLHTTLFADKDGVPLANIVFHFADGQTQAVRLGYGVHVRNWTTPRLEKTDALLDPNSRLAAGEGDERRGDSSRVFQTALENPRPAEPIASFDVVSLFSHATPVILAITVEDSDSTLPPNRPLPPRKAIRDMNAFSDAVYRRELQARVTDAETGTPATNAIASLAITDDKQTYFLGETRTDAQGVCRLVYPPQYAVGFSLWIHAPDLMPALISESRTNESKFKDSYTVSLKRGATIGGVVRDPGGKAISGAEVLIHRVTKTGTRHYTQIDYDSVFTDKNGVWQSHCVPANLTGFTLQVFHPDYRPALYATPGFAPPPAAASVPVVNNGPRTTYRRLPDGTLVPMTRPPPRSQSMPLLTTNALLAGTAEMILQPALPLEGTLVDNADKPVPGAEVIFQRRGGGRTFLRTDAAGHFRARVPDPGDATLVVLRPGFTPLARNIPVSSNTAPVQLKLEPERVLRGHVQDQKSRPIAGARVRLEEWNDTTDLLKFQAVTDENGSFTWTGAPPDSVMFFVTKTNFSSTRTSFSGQTDSITFRLSRPPGVYGKVYDAETKQPIPTFTVVPGRKYSPNESQIQWERYSSMRGRDGEYSLRMSSYYFQPEGYVLVEAMGYEPQISPPFRGSDSYTNDFALKKGKGLEGVVLLPDGKPAAGAILVLAETGDNAFLDNAGQVRSSGSGSDMVRTDSNGRFEFTPKLAPQRLFASHEQGYAEATFPDVSKTGKIVLQKWGRVKGVVRVGDKIEPPGQTVYLQFDDMQRYVSGPRLPMLSSSLRTESDAGGAFAFEKVPPGDHRVSIEFHLKEKENNQAYELALSHGVPVTVKPGETADVTIGGSGRRVTGHVDLKGGEQSDVDWKRDVHRLSLVVPAPVFPAPNMAGRSPAERQQAWAEFNRKQQEFWQTPEGRARQRAERNYVLLFDTNGDFYVDNVPPGNYQLAIQVTDPEDELYNRRSIGNVQKQITVPDDPKAKVNAPFDVGAIELTIRPRIRIGKAVPSFEGKTADGKTIQLSSLRGKTVLLYFWGRSMGYSSYDFQVLKELQSAYGSSGKLFILGCNLDPDPEGAAKFAKSQGQTWTQVYLGSWNQTPVPAMFGLQGNTGCVLIDPEGKLASNPLRGTAIRNAVSSIVGSE